MEGRGFYGCLGDASVECLGMSWRDGSGEGVGLVAQGRSVCSMCNKGVPSLHFSADLLSGYRIVGLVRDSLKRCRLIFLVILDLYACIFIHFRCIVCHRCRVFYFSYNSSIIIVFIFIFIFIF